MTTCLYKCETTTGLFQPAACVGPSVIERMRVQHAARHVRTLRSTSSSCGGSAGPSRVCSAVLVCGGEHATNSRDCAAKFRKHKVIALKGGTKRKSAAKKKSRHLGLPGESPSRDDNTAKPAPSTGNDGKRPPTQPSPQGDKGNCRRRHHAARPCLGQRCKTWNAGESSSHNYVSSVSLGEPTRTLEVNGFDDLWPGGCLACSAPMAARQRAEALRKCEDLWKILVVQK
ncbi:hypothetical protein HPB50_028293 [Hyalomma asiaticum]|nr:hypothetical protein HPB50_028293 [Hyalomma asiaticum]